MGNRALYSFGLSIVTGLFVAVQVLCFCPPAEAASSGAPITQMSDGKMVSGHVSTMAGHHDATTHATAHAHADDRLAKVPHPHMDGLSKMERDGGGTDCDGCNQSQSQNALNKQLRQFVSVVGTPNLVPLPSEAVELIAPANAVVENIANPRRAGAPLLALTLVALKTLLLS